MQKAGKSEMLSDIGADTDARNIENLFDELKVIVFLYLTRLKHFTLYSLHSLKMSMLIVIW